MTIMVPALQNQRDLSAKLRILQTANTLFYVEGIRNVGVDRLIGRSTVTKATFYKYYGSKEHLIVDYIQTQRTTAEQKLTALSRSYTSAESTLRALIAMIVADIANPGFRGCAFVNAAAEFADPQHPVRTIVSLHREWYTNFLTELLGRLGHPVPGDAADELMLARDGAMSGGYAGDPIAASAALMRVADCVIHRAIDN